MYQPCIHLCLQELRNRLLAEETRRQQALLRLVESTERAKNTREIGDLVECVDAGIDAGWMELRQGMNGACLNLNVTHEKDRIQ